MMKYKALGFLLVLAFAKAAYTTAQSTPKIEQEEKITAADFPEKALLTVQVIGLARKKVKFYKETDGDTSTFEAKLKYGGSKYSIEFNEMGVLEDVEIHISKRKIPKKIRHIIEQQLDTMARKYRIEKVQQQYVNNNQNDLELRKRIDQLDFDNYELIVAFKDQKRICRKELLFDKNGKLLLQRDVKRLEYDFILF